MKNNKTRKLIGGGIKYKTRSIPLKFLKEEEDNQQTTNIINFNSNSIDKTNLGEQVLVIIKKIQTDLNSNNNNNITFSIVGKNQI